MAEITGLLEVESDGKGRSNVTRRYAKYPLRFLFMDRTRNPGGTCIDSFERYVNCQWVYPVNYGGGLVSGDTIIIQFTLQENSRCVVTTQASTKVYKYLPNREGTPQNTVQRLSYELKAHSFLCVFPEPVTCFKDARFVQYLDYNLCESSSLIHVDWSTSGRLNREHWEMQCFESNTCVKIDSRTVFSEHVRLETTEDGGLSIAARMAGFNVMAIVVVAGRLLLENTKFINHLATALKSSDNHLCSQGKLSLKL